MSVRPSRPFVSKADNYRDHVKRLVADAPKLTPAKARRLVVIMGGAR